ncbi:extensin-like domain-containing protein [Rhodovulum adriaticum]|uniref:Extensin-like C-terminal domain-containing protein n=2 Tax=Rhodovulum adriaticum TaxID=35804 RepID=A0A4R2NL83_RHOAD|nr:extensin family protein [Rhodovulum adriaticum]MBK1635187.1 hypothetical protein [Rhodovulum adriaticum]TCP22300.1 hypothetical protein EV656_107110 [Rhodovulum adriaticum]
MALCLAAFALAAAPAAALDRSPRPQPRPGPVEVLPRTPLAPVYYTVTIRPYPRPALAARGPILLVPVYFSAGLRPAPRPRIARALAAVISPAATGGLARSPRPVARPGLRVASAAAAAPAIVTRGRVGTICGDPAIRGVALAPIPGRMNGCGVDNPVRVDAVDGVTLNQPATIDCRTARALRDWVQGGVKPAVGRLGGGVDSLRVVASYTCRTRNNRPGAKISEHGRGRAVDIAAVNLKNGITLSVEDGWDDPVQGKLLRQMHKSACGTFGTVLGPGSDGYHQDHIHLDTARYRSGAYCR